MSKISALLAMIVCASLVAAYSPVQGAVMDDLLKAAADGNVAR